MQQVRSQQIGCAQAINGRFCGLCFASLVSYMTLAINACDFAAFPTPQEHATAAESRTAQDHGH